MKYIHGIDIGYSNLKTVTGPSGTIPKEILLPAGAGPASKMVAEFASSTDGDGKNFVNINGEDWVAGISMSQLEGVERDLHADYPVTDKYRALFYASLMMAETDHIDTLVTGLPVDQFKNFELRERLVERLKGGAGGHKINNSRTVTVGDVIVLPQPVGAYMDLLSHIEDIELMEEGRILVLDPGFFSCDWVMMQGKALKKDSSGTSTQAMSRVLEQAADLINKEHQSTSCSKDQLEDAIRRDKKYIFIDGNRCVFKQAVKQAAAQVAPQALAKMRQSMRDDSRNPDIVLLAGGGGEVYAEAAREIFPRSRVEVPRDPTLANARGYWFYGE